MTGITLFKNKTVFPVSCFFSLRENQLLSFLFTRGVWVFPFPTTVEPTRVTWRTVLFYHNTEPLRMSTTTTTSVQGRLLTSHTANFFRVQSSTAPEPSTRPSLSLPHGTLAVPMHQRGLTALRSLWTCSTCSVAAEGATSVESGKHTAVAAPLRLPIQNRKKIKLKCYQVLLTCRWCQFPVLFV